MCVRCTEAPGPLKLPGVLTQTASMSCAGALHGVNTEVNENDFHDVVLGARIGRACYELYHQAASGLAPDSVTYKQANGQPLPPRDEDTARAPGTIKRRPGGKR